MYWDGLTLKNMAKNALRGSYWKVVLVSILLGIGAGMSASSSANNGYQAGYSYSGNIGSYSFSQHVPAGGITLSLVFGLGFTLAVSIFLLGPLEVGCRRFLIEDLYQDTDLNTLGTGFKRNYWNVLAGQFFRNLYVFLWSMLFIIPGIIKNYEYRMVPYILAEDPDVEPNDALRISKEMMYGEKMNAFLFDLSFIGWFILGIITCGLALIFYVNPYYNLSCSALYHALKDKYFKSHAPVGPEMQ